MNRLLVLLTCCLIVTSLTLPACAQEAAPAATEPPLSIRSLSDFGDLSTADGVRAALDRALDELMTQGGGIVSIPPDAPATPGWYNLSQTDQRGPGVTVLDYRDGFVSYHLSPIGKHQTGVWAGMRLNRQLNLAPDSLPHCGTYSNLGIQNYMVSGATSYMATLTDPVEPGEDVRCYVDLIRGIWVGAYLTVTSSVMGYAPPYDRILVKSIGWDDERNTHYFTADLEYPHPAGALVYNKHVVNGLQIEGYSNCDNQSMELNVLRHNYAVGDSFVISGVMKYQSDIFSGFGDEGGVVLNAETVGVLHNFRSTVEAVDWSRDELTFAPGHIYPHALANSRPLINMNEDKWITQGEVRIVSPGGTYQGQSYPGEIGGPGNVFNYQGGLILGSPDTPWDESILGRFFCVTDPTEVILPDDRSSAGGYAQLPDHPIYRWYQIRELHQNEDGTKVLKILRVRWSAVAAGAPKLFRDDNYTSDDHDRPLSYAIAPGAWVYDISEGWADTFPTGGRLDASHPRKLKLAAHADRGTRFDFEPGDPIQQAVGPDPWHPRPVRIRQFDQLPSTMPNASIEVEQLGRVQVSYGLRLSGIIRSSDQLDTRKDARPPYDTMLHLDSLSRVGLEFAGEVTDAAMVFAQPNDRPQPVRWRQNVTGSSSLTVDPQTGTFELRGGGLDLGNQSLESVRGLSSTDQPARNLRGINLAVPAGSEEFAVTFPTPESDAAYAVTVTPSWLTPVAVSGKSERGFTAHFATPAPEAATLDWVIVR